LEVERERDTEREDHHHEDVGEGEDEPRANLRDRLLGFFDRAESEPDPADRDDVRRMRGVVLDLLAEPRDVDVEGLGGAEPMRVPDLVHDPLSTKDLAGVRHQQMQEIELAGREHDRIPVLRDRPRRGVETEGSDLERAPLFARASPAHDGPDPSRELPRREGFDDVVVGAQLEPEDAIDLLPSRGEHHDRDIRSLTDLASEITSVSVRQHHVEQDEVRRLTTDGLAGTRERRRHLGFEPVSSEALRQWLRDGCFVLDEEDPGPHSSMVLVTSGPKGPARIRSNTR
jgi:hypothetical protein